MLTEILKLHDKAAKKEEILRAADQQLTTEMHKFDEFLRATDRRAHIAMKVGNSLRSKFSTDKQQERWGARTATSGVAKLI